MTTAWTDHASRPSRRAFLGATAMAGAALSAASYARVIGANDRVGVGYIGFGLIGKRHVIDFQAQADVAGVAVCDAHRGRVEEARALVGGPVKGHADFRRLLDDRDVDAVVVSTPDHWHALMTLMACAAGKDVYIEKPLTLFVREGRWMVDVAKRTNRVVQVGTQQRSGAHYRRARDLIREGAIGRVHAVTAGAHRNIMPGFGRPPDGDPPPDLDWDLFLGPAPMRPYNPNRGLYHFRWFWDTSGGQMTNLGHHSLDIVHWALGGEPSAVSSLGGRLALEDNGETPDTQDAIFQITDSRSQIPDSQLQRSDSRASTGAGYLVSWRHREASAGPGPAGDAGFGLQFHGTRGTLGISRRGFAITPDRKVPPENRVPQFTGAHPVGGPQRQATPGPAESWAEAVEDRMGRDAEQFVGHVRDFLDCVKSRETPASDLESSHRVSTQCHLANIALRLGRSLRWDAAREAIPGDAEAHAMLVRPYRQPWDREREALGLS